MATQPRSRLTPEEYLALERGAEHKSEYMDGEAVADPEERAQVEQARRWYQTELLDALVD